MRMNVNAMSRLAQEWVREEIKKLGRLNMADIELEERRKNAAEKAK